VAFTESERLGLFDKVRELFGPDHAGVLMEMLPSSGWGEVTTKADLRMTANEFHGEISELRGEMSELRGEMSELRGEMSEVRGEIKEVRAEVLGSVADLRTETAWGFARIETQFAQQTRTVILTLIGFAITVWATLLVSALA
jgi:hypothetical protein